MWSQGPTWEQLCEPPLLHFPFSSLPANVPGEVVNMAQCLGPLPPAWETQSSGFLISA